MTDQAPERGRLAGRAIFVVALSVFLAGCAREPALEFEHRTIRLDLAHPEQALKRSISLPADRFAIVRVQGIGSEVRASLGDPGAEPVGPVELPYSRLNPLFLTTSPNDGEREVTLTIEPLRTTESGWVEVTVSLAPRGAPGAEQAFSAFGAMARALSTDMDDWERGVELLGQASEALHDLGMTEEALWAGYMRAYLVYSQPFDLVRSLALADAVLADARAHEAPLVELAALQLIGGILAERSREDAPHVARAKFERGQRVLEEAQSLARTLDRPYEAGWALNNSGIGYFYRKRHKEALAQYDRALDVMRAVGDDKVTQMVLSNRALALESLGHYDEAIQALREVARFQEVWGDPGPLAGTYRELGRVYRALADYRLAIRYLVRAQAHYRSLDDRGGEGRTLMSLGIAYMQMGRLGLARDHFELGSEMLGDEGSGNDVRDAFVHMADLARLEGDFERAARLRDRQAELVASDVDRARLALKRAQDEHAAGDSAAALHHVGQCLEVSGPDAATIEALSCRLLKARLLAASDPTAVDLEAAREVADRLTDTAVARHDLQARKWLAETEDLLGERNAALDTAAGLVERMAFYRRTLPGVMGAWYWESRKQVLAFYFERLLARNRGREGGALENFLTLAALHNLNLRNAADEARGAGETIAAGPGLRELLALREQTEDGARRALLDNRISDRLMAALGRDGERASPAFSDPLEWTPADLPSDTGVLAWYLGGTVQYAWLATQSGVRQYELPAGRDSGRVILEARDAIRTAGAEAERERLFGELGERLLGPVRDDLPRRLRVLNSGPLAGFPLDSLQLGGSPLAARHEVVQIQGLQGVKGLKQRPVAPAASRVVLAGAPSVAPSGSPGLPGTWQELDALARAFGKANITRLSGGGQALEELMAALATSPDIVHIASHATVNLEYPELSSIELAGPVAGIPDRERFLLPADLEHLRLDGGMVVLSACQTSGEPQFVFDTHLGFVSGFLNAGATLVVASLWPVSDRQTAAFMTDFYGHLMAGLAPATALAATKRDWIARQQSVRDWAAFQVYSL